MQSPPNRPFRKGFVDAIPIGVTFFFLFLAVGGAARKIGLDIWQATMMTALTFAAPAQLVVMQPVVDHAWIPALVATAVINFRFLIMSATLQPYFAQSSRLKVLLSMHFLSASTFAVSFPHLAGNTEREPLQYYLGVSVISFLLAVAATTGGYLWAEWLPAWLSDSLRMVLPIYFTVLMAKAWPQRLPLLAGGGGFIAVPLLTPLLGDLALVIAALAIGGMVAAMDRGKETP